MTARRQAGAFLVRALKACDREIERAIPRVEKNADEEAVHDLRVGIRRMRVLLKLARPVFGRYHADTVRAAYTVVHRSTGDLRDAEVLDLTLGDLGLHDAAFERWLASKRAREAVLRRALIRGLGRGDLSRARHLLHSLLALAVDPDKDHPLHKFGKRCVQSARRKVARLQDTPADDAAGLHRLRIAYKGLRYSAEILGAGLPPEVVTLAERAAKFQKRLGEIHDLDMASAVVRRAKLLPQDDKTRALLVLAQARQRAVTRYLAEPPVAPDAAPEEQNLAVG